MIARLSALDATFAPRGPQEGIMGKHCGSLSTRKPTEPPYVVNCKTRPACGNRCSMPRGKALYPLLMAELDAMKAAAAQGAA